VTSLGGIPKEEENKREREALDEMCRVLGGGVRAA
jgi:putative hydrolase of HD superfamily